jgi:uncharacterized SAM-binding protein YcdF (DUF218 family)
MAGFFASPACYAPDGDMPSRPGDGARVAIVAIALSAAWFVLAWAAANLLVVRAELPLADALVVLSSGATYIERTHHAAQLLGEGRATAIIVMNDGLQGGWSQTEQRTLYYFERTIEELSRRGVQPERIRFLPDVVPDGTFGEAKQLRRYAERLGLRSLLIVTSAYHSRRTLWIFHRVFAGTGVAIGVAPAPPGQQTPRPSLWWLSPLGWRMVAGEYVKGTYYLLRHRGSEG